MMRLKEELSPRILVNSLVGGLVIGITEIFLSISLSSLVFRGPLETYFALGAGLAIVSTAIFFGFVTIMSTRVGIFPSTQDVTTVLMAVIIATLAATLPDEELLPTALAALAFCTLTAGLVLVGAGFLNLGKLIRYMPYPVLGGFLAATGFLLATGAISSVTGIEFSLPTLETYLNTEQVMLWLPAVLIGIVTLIVSRKVTNPFVFPALMVSIVIIFFAIFAISGISTSQATEMGFLYQPDISMIWKPLTPGIIKLVDWKAIFSQAGNIAALLGMTMVGFLLNLSALEADQGEEFKLNRELALAGGINILVGIAGGFIGYHAVALTRLGARLGVKSRFTGIFIAMICLFTLWAGTSMLTIIPRPLVSGLLFFLGLDFLYDWVFTAWKRFSRNEYLIVIMIMGVIIVTDFLTGIVVGLLAMVVLFIVNYSRIKVYRFATSGTTTRSIIKRSNDQSRILDAYGDQIFVLELQGYLFFGTANTLLEQVKRRMQEPGMAPLRYLVLDFRTVTGLDTSAALAFFKTDKLCQTGGVTMVLTSVSKEIFGRLQNGGFNPNSPGIKQFEDLDHGLEWCEERLLDSLCEDPTCRRLSVEELFQAEGMTQAEVSRLLTYFKSGAFEKGSNLWKKGDPADSLFIIVNGRVSVIWENSAGVLARLSTLGPGTSVGEIGLYLGAQRSAIVVADEATEGLVMTREALDCLQKDDPTLASAFHIFISRQLAGWVLQADQKVVELRKSS